MINLLNTKNKYIKKKRTGLLQILISQFNYQIIKLIVIELNLEKLYLRSQSKPKLMMKFHMKYKDLILYHLNQHNVMFYKLKPYQIIS